MSSAVYPSLLMRLSYMCVPMKTTSLTMGSHLRDSRQVLMSASCLSVTHPTGTARGFLPRLMTAKFPRRSCSASGYKGITDTVPERLSLERCIENSTRREIGRELANRINSLQYLIRLVSGVGALPDKID